MVSNRWGSNTISCLWAKGVNVSVCSFRDRMSRNSSLVVRASLTMSARKTPNRWLPVLMRRNSISWLTSLVSRWVPRRTVCTAERDTWASPFSVSLSAAPEMIASGVRNSWAMWVKKFRRKVVSSFSTRICWCNSKLRRHTR